MERSPGRNVAAVMLSIVGIVVLALLLTPIAGASRGAAPSLQAATETTTAATEAAATAAATTTTGGTAVAATATTQPSNLPTTGGDSGLSMILLGLAALLILGVAATFLLSGRRNT
jgi:LPXTG-motif cell wall-anchored protein